MERRLALTEPISFWGGFDAGTGAGAFVFGFVVGAAGFFWSFCICAALLVAALGFIPGTREKKQG